MIASNRSFVLIVLSGVLSILFAASSSPAQNQKNEKKKSSSEHVVYPSQPPTVQAKIKVEAGEYQRINTPVSIELPPRIKAWRSLRLFEVTDGNKTPIPSQIEAGSPPRLWFTLSGTTAAHAVRRFELWPGDPVTGEAVELDLTATTLDVSFGGQRLFSYNHAHVLPPSGVKEEFIRSGYIHPMFNPSGQLITEDFPDDHYHHKGIWMPWTNTVFEGHRVDFWNLGDRSGRVQFAGFESIASGPVYGGFKVKHEHVDVTQPDGGKIALNETWDVRIWSQGGPKAGYWLFDITSTQRCATDSPLLLPEYRYGGMAFRGAKEWVDDTYVVLTSEGKTKEDGHTTRARWSAHSGAIDGKWSTVVLHSHPKNFRHPEPQRIWPKNGAFFNWAPSQAGDWSIEPGRDYVWRYRFFVHQGKVSAEEAERTWRDFAHPPQVSLK